MSPSNIDFLACEATPLGLICLRQRELLSEPGTVVTEITLDHEFLMSSHNTASERALALRALSLRGGRDRDLSVLVGGLGLGYTAREVLGSQRVGRIEVVEFLPQVIDWLDRRLLPLADQLNGDPRLAVVEGDVYARLSRAPGRRYDLILVDVDHSPDEPLGNASAAFYTREGLGRARRHLAPGGVLGVWSYAQSPAFTAAFRAVFGEVWIEPVTFENRVVGGEETNWLFLARD